MDRGSSDTEDEDEGGARHNGILFRTADPRYLENPKDPQRGDTILDIGKIRELLHMNSTLADSAGEFWLSSRDMDYDIDESATSSTKKYRFNNLGCPHCRAGKGPQTGEPEAITQWGKTVRASSNSLNT